MARADCNFQRIFYFTYRLFIYFFSFLKDYFYELRTNKGVVPRLDRGADKLVRLGGRWRGLSLTLVLGVSLEGVYLSRLSVESDLSILTTNFHVSEII